MGDLFHFKIKESPSPPFDHPPPTLLVEKRNERMERMTWTQAKVTLISSHKAAISVCWRHSPDGPNVQGPPARIVSIFHPHSLLHPLQSKTVAVAVTTIVHFTTNFEWGSCLSILGGQGEKRESVAAMLTMTGKCRPWYIGLRHMPCLSTI